MSPDGHVGSHEPALDLLAIQYWGPLVAYAQRFLGDVASAEDVVQHAFVRLWESKSATPNGDDARALLYRIVRNLVLNELRRSQVREHWASDQWVDETEPIASDDLVERHELRAAIEAAVDQLPPKRREVFVLSRFHELSNEEIASILSISPQTVANQLVGAMRTLRLLLRSCYEEHAYPPLKVVRDRDLLTG